MLKIKKLLFLSFLLTFLSVSGQVREISKAVFVDSVQGKSSPALSKDKLVPPIRKNKVVNPRNRGINKIVPGKGLPVTNDKARQKEPGKTPSRSPELTFEAAGTFTTPTDPTGAIGPNHYVNGLNSEFSVFDKNGNQLVPPSSLSSIGGEFTGENDGDPTIVYDEFADRFLIMQYYFEPHPNPRLDPLPPFGLLIAVSRGPDPVNSGWYTYRFDLPSFPDYPKLSVWSDGYYITTNKDFRTAATSEVIYVAERDKMLQGQDARIIGFPLPGINVNRFYSPGGFHAIGDEMPPRGNAPIVYLQDDSWAGVSEDHLKIWNINVNWQDPSASTIEEYQELGASAGVTPFISTFDGGDFENLDQPGDDTFRVDALQANMMYMTQYRRFSTHNSVVMNFVVDVDATSAVHAGIRWYELRQDSNGGPWGVYQEGTYAPDKSDRWCGSIGIDKYGNIGLGFTIMDNSPVTPIFPSIRYTGRFANDPLGIMTVIEQSIVEGFSPNPSFRYGDYAHLTVDPVDGVTFWHNGEYFVGNERKNQVGVFRLSPTLNNDVGIIELVNPVSSTLSNSEEIKVTIWNYGFQTQTNIPVSYTINGGQPVNEVFTGSLESLSSVTYTFSTTANLGQIGETYEIKTSTNLPGDEEQNNDALTKNIIHLFPKDVGVTSIDAPSTGLELSSAEPVTVTIENFGGEPQSNIPVSYALFNNVMVEEVFTGTIPVGEDAVYTFSNTANVSSFGRVDIFAKTNLEGDGDTTNDGISKSIANLNCIPRGSDCSLGDGIHSFILGNFRNERIPCIDGYADFMTSAINLDRPQGTYTVRVMTRYDHPEDEQFSLWIDLNDSGTFDDDERLITSESIPSAGVNHSFDFTLPADAPLGEHLMRVRAGDVSFEGDLNDPCSVMEFGTTHDYVVRIIDSNLSLDDFLLNDANLIISNQGNGIFRVYLETTFDMPLRISVHNLLGQKLLENQVETNGEGYLYEMDMSYAATGVYLLRIGTREVGRVKRFIVE